MMTQLQKYPEVNQETKSLQLLNLNKKYPLFFICQESGWNDRFHLNHIPEYDYLNQPHSQCMSIYIKILKINLEFQLEKMIIVRLKDYMNHRYKKVTIF